MTETTTKPSGQFTRRDHLLTIEEWAQSMWRDTHAYERNPPNEATTPDATTNVPKKYMVTFPYPYMNGKLHLGHAFTVTKAEFAVRFQQLQGAVGFFPFAFHCTGMPIQAAAGNLARELADGELADGDEVEAPVVAESSQAAASQPGVFKSKKSKAKAKTGAMSQADILRSMDISESEFPKFTDPMHWLSFFPPLGQADLTRFGLAIDWRRAFITTEANPYYDAFIRWQFRRLKAGGYIGFGNRPAVFSRREQQPCADHDRASGEGVGCQEYTLIKLKVVTVPQKLQAAIDQHGVSAVDGVRGVFMVAATLRPETMYGQTNCYVLPEGQYGLFYGGVSQGYFVCSKRAADNLVWQGVGEKELNPETGLLEAKLLCLITGRELLGLAVEAPLSAYGVVHVLPMLTISMVKGTGIVTSVPSDSPDDFACLRDWQTKANWRSQHGVDVAWVKDFAPIDIIEIADFPKMAELIETEKVESHRDREKLEVIKKQCYLKGFDLGVMKVGDYKGLPVKEAKPLIRKMLVEKNMAVPYWEPESQVVSRSGDECVVALCDQWYINYGEPDWMAKVVDHVTNGGFTMFNPKASNQQLNAVEWFKSWACSRTFGLGTKLPWDEKWIIESLSDSTIYMAYYAIAHYLQGDLEGKTRGLAGLKPEQIGDDLFDYVFELSETLPKSISADLAQAMRKEFSFWYPMDLRVSGKDLIPNHLTMSLYIHAAIWPNRADLWPRAFFANGHIEVDAEKMSKSKGNFLTIDYVNKEFGADATRIALADAGDDLENANFSKKTASDSILALYTLENWIREYMAEVPRLRSGPMSFIDKVFKNEMARLVAECEAAYKRMSFRGALKAAWFDLVNLREQYRLLTEEDKMHEDLVKEYVEIQTLLLFPIAPHFCEHVWQRILGHQIPLAKTQGVWPKVASYDLSLGRKFHVLQDSLRQFRLEMKKWKTPENPPNVAVIFVAKEYLPYQQEVLKMLAEHVQFDPVTFEPLDRKYTNDLKAKLPAGPSQALALKFAAFHVQTEVKARGLEALELALPFDEAQMFADQINLIKKQLCVCTVEIRPSNEPFAEDTGKITKREQAIPAKPSILFLRRN